MSSNETIARLEEQIATLTSLSSRISSLRSIPPHLLQPPAFGLSGAPCYVPDFSQFQEISDTIKSDRVQNALKAARDGQSASDTQDSTIVIEKRRKTRKRRLSPQSELESSPQPFTKGPCPSLKKRSSLFPTTTAEPALQSTQLTEFVRSFNRIHSQTSHSPMELKFWRKTRPTVGHSQENEDSVTVLRFRIPDVLTAYITVTTDAGGPLGQLFIESVTGFAPREPSFPHSQSIYTIYQAFTQHIARMLQSDPTVSLQTLMDLLISYQGLFIEKCKCGRVTSAEGHTPPIVRAWLLNEETGQHCWTPRHVGCR